jgi:hypothetical protein
MEDGVRHNGLSFAGNLITAIKVVAGIVEGTYNHSRFAVASIPVAA